MGITPFTIPFSHSDVEDLRQRLNRTRWPDAPATPPWRDGTDLSFLKEICAYWKDSFDWQHQVERLNSFPNFRFTRNGLGIHFLHVRGNGPRPTPLLLTHGWPGSFVEMLHILPLLTDPAAHGVHLNYIPGSYKPFLEDGAEPTLEEKEFLATAARWYEEEGAYAHMHRTRPQTAAYSLNDSPAGLAAWILEKFRAWSDCGGDLLSHFTRDQLLTNLTLYWMTQTIASSMRMYRANGKTPLQFSREDFVRPPVALACFPKEILQPPRSWVQRGYNLNRWTKMPRGGHFAAMEEPQLLAGDMRAFFRELRG